MLEKSPDLIDGPDPQGWHPLHHAAKNGWSRVTSFLVERKVAIDARTVSEDLAASHIATMHGHLAVLRQLLDAGARRNLTFNCGKAKNSLPPVPGHLASQSADWSLLDLAIIYDRSAIIDLLLAGTPEEVAWLLNRTGPILRGVPLGLVSPKSIKLTPIQLSIWLNRFPTAVKLVEQGADLRPIGGDDQFSALLFATSCRRPFAMWLIAHGADPNAGQPKSGFTPLHQAIDNKDLELARALIKAGAKVNTATTKGSTPLHFARTPETVTLLLENGATCNNPDRLAQHARLLPDVLEQYFYPKARKPNAILLTDDHYRIKIRTIETRRSPDATPPPLADVLAMHCLTRERQSSHFSNNTRVGTLRVFRRNAGGGIEAIFTARDAEVAQAEFPALQWGDLVEVNVLHPERREFPIGTPTYDELLAARVKPREVTIEFGPVSSPLTLPLPRAKPDYYGVRPPWKAIDLRTLLDTTLRRSDTKHIDFEVHREGVADPIGFTMSRDWQFPLAAGDRVRIPLPKSDPRSIR